MQSSAKAPAHMCIYAAGKKGAEPKRHRSAFALIYIVSNLENVADKIGPGARPEPLNQVDSLVRIAASPAASLRCHYVSAIPDQKPVSTTSVHESMP
jgi:hypothetical protein